MFCPSIDLKRLTDVTKRLTRFLGPPKFEPGSDRVEVDITSRPATHKRAGEERDDVT